MMDNFKSTSQIANEVATRTADRLQQLENIHANETLAVMKGQVEEILFDFEAAVLCVVNRHVSRLKRRGRGSLNNTAQRSADAYFAVQNFRLAATDAGQGIIRALSLPDA